MKAAYSEMRLMETKSCPIIIAQCPLSLRVRDVLGLSSKVAQQSAPLKCNFQASLQQVISSNDPVYSFEDEFLVQSSYFFNLQNRNA